MYSTCLNLNKFYNKVFYEIVGPICSIFALRYTKEFRHLMQRKQSRNTVHLINPRNNFRNCNFIIKWNYRIIAGGAIQRNYKLILNLSLLELNTS